jgi:hypothetical protein
MIQHKEAGVSRTQVRHERRNGKLYESICLTNDERNGVTVKKVS